MQQNLPFTPYLRAGEKWIWWGRPKQGFVLRKGEIPVILFSMVWAGFAMFWEYQVVTGGAPFFMALFGIPFVAVGLYMVFGRFVTDITKRRKTLYVLTNQRLLSLEGLTGVSLRSVELDHSGPYSLDIFSDGTGTITVGNQDGVSVAGFSNLRWGKHYGAARNADMTFELIDEPAKILKSIEKAREEHERSSAAPPRY